MRICSVFVGLLFLGFWGCGKKVSQDLNANVPKVVRYTLEGEDAGLTNGFVFFSEGEPTLRPKSVGLKHFVVSDRHGWETEIKSSPRFLYENSNVMLFVCAQSETDPILAPYTFYLIGKKDGQILWNKLFKDPLKNYMVYDDILYYNFPNQPEISHISLK